MREKVAKTMQMRLGFVDNDMNKPLHDQIMIWLDHNAASVVNDVFVAKEWREQDVSSLRDAVEKIIGQYKADIRPQNPRDGAPGTRIRKTIALADLSGKWVTPDQLRNETPLSNKQLNIVENWRGLGDDLPKKSAATISSKEWEHPVISQTSNSTTGYRSPKQIVGYVDMKITFNYTRLAVQGVDFEFESLDGGTVRWCESNFKTPGIHNNLRGSETLTASILVEVKTEISNLGELFRQLNTYKEFENLPILIVCPDDTHATLIKEQGFYFYKYPTT